MTKPGYIDDSKAKAEAHRRLALKVMRTCCMKCENLGDIKCQRKFKRGGKNVTKLVYGCNVHPETEIGLSSAGCSDFINRLKMRHDLPPVEEWGPF